MAEDSASEDKTEEPSSKRLEDARKKGQIPRSRELNTVIMLLLSATLIASLGHNISQGLLEIMRYSFTPVREQLWDAQTLLIYFKRASLDAGALLVPLLAVLIVASFLGPIALGGWNISWDAVSPKFSKLNPLTGLVRLFSPKSLIELLKALLKVVLLSAVAYGVFQLYLAQLLGLHHEPVAQGIVHSAQILVRVFLILSATLLLVALFDAPYQWWSHHQQLKMTKQEVRDEAKESDGNPEVKGHIRRLQMAMAQGRMMSKVPTADVVVTNPSHFAVALKYDPKVTSAPVVVAKGIDLLAARIRNLATENNIPLVAAPPLARALYYATELEQEIPQGLFAAVAQVLAYVFSLKNAKTQGWPIPTPPEELRIPEEFNYK